MPIRNCDCKIILLSDLLVSHRSRLESWSEAIVWICACVMKRNLESLIVVASLACRFNTPKNALGTRSIFNVDIHEHFSPFRELKAVCVSGWTSFSCSKKLGFFFSSPFVFWRMSFHFWLSCVAFSHRKNQTTKHHFIKYEYMFQKFHSETKWTADGQGIEIRSDAHAWAAVNFFMALASVKAEHDFLMIIAQMLITYAGWNFHCQV